MARALIRFGNPRIGGEVMWFHDDAVGEFVPFLLVSADRGRARLRAEDLD
jgi:hypothetical protein